MKRRIFRRTSGAPSIHTAGAPLPDGAGPELRDAAGAPGCLSMRDVGVAVAAPTGEERTLLHPTSLRITEHRVALIGSNGQGKTTLLRCIARLTEPTTGTVDLDGDASVAAARARIGFLFADTAAQLIMPTVGEDIELSLRRLELGRRERAERADALLSGAGLEGFGPRSVHELSGGERQLVALTGVLATRPSWVLADEPTAALDLVNRHRVVRALAEAPAHVLVATHDLDLAAGCDRVLWVHDGRVVADGEPAGLIERYRACAAGELPWPGTNAEADRESTSTAEAGSMSSTSGAGA